MSVLDLRALLGALDEHGVDFVVIGGVAVGAHGYVRATEDLDIVPAPEKENIDRLARALGSLNASLPLADGRPFRAAGDVIDLQRRRNLTLDTDRGGLDIVQSVPGAPGYATLAARAVIADLLGLPVSVCSLADLREMKAARGSAQDRADLENLPEG